MNSAMNVVSFRQRLQAIDGLGFAIAFQRATLIRGDRGLSPASTRALLDLLFDPETGAGSSIVRIGIGSSADGGYDRMKSILPTDRWWYEWDGDDGGQVWFLKHAQRYGVRRILANAWSAPGFMKTNGADGDGGRLCPKWCQAYADYLVQFLRFYRREGIRVTDLGFTNEPDYTASWASMRFTPEEAVRMVKVLGPALRGSGLSTRLVCCDALGWHEQAPYSAAIEADPVASRHVSVHTGHMYASPPDRLLPTGRTRWMSEWNPDGDTWSDAWDDGSGWSGMVVAESIHQTFAQAHASAYIYWVAASLGPTRALIQIADGADEYRVSKRFWAYAAFARFVRPGAVRVRTHFTDPHLKVTAYRNRDGAKIIQLLHPGTAGARLAITTDTAIHRITTYLTDERHSLAKVADDAGLGGARRLCVRLPARSLTTLVLR